MDISKLTAGMKVKNFKELNKLIEGEDCKIRTGMSKVSFLKELSSYVQYDKIGNSFIIKNIYKTPVEIIDGRKKGNNNKYNAYTENLILHLLKRSKNDHVGYLSKTGFLIETEIVNENFVKGRDDYGYLAEYLRIPYDGVKEFYQSYTIFFTNLIKNAIKSLEKKGIIRVENGTMIILSNNSVKMADEDDHLAILEFEYGIRQELLSTGRYNNSNINIAISNAARNRCLKELGFKKYFSVYKIYFSNKILDIELTEQNQIESKELLNKAIEANINRTSTNNWKKYMDKNKPDFGVRNDLMTKELYKNCAKDVFHSFINEPVGV